MTEEFVILILVQLILILGPAVRIRRICIFFFRHDLLPRSSDAGPVSRCVAQQEGEELLRALPEAEALRTFRRILRAESMDQPDMGRNITKRLFVPLFPLSTRIMKVIQIDRHFF